MSPATARTAKIDVGLREYMLRVYNYMASGLALTGIIAYLSATTPAILNMLYAMGPDGAVRPTVLAYIAMFSPLAFILVLNFGLQRMKASTVQVLWKLFAQTSAAVLLNQFPENLQRRCRLRRHVKI